MNIIVKTLHRIMGRSHASQGENEIAVKGRAGKPVGLEDTILLTGNKGSITENPIVYRCLRLISQNIASIGVKVECNEQEFWLSVMMKPNRHQKLNQMVQYSVSDLMIEGNAYLLNLDKKPGFYRIDPRHVSEIVDPMGNAIGYHYQTQKGLRKVFIDSEGCCEILKIKYVGPGNPNVHKLSPCKVVERAVRLYDSITDYNQAIMNNMASFGGALVVKGRLRDEQLQLLRQVIDARKGVHRAGHTAILHGSENMDIKWEPMKANARDADYVEGQSFVAKEIMQVFGVPPNLLGISDIAYNNYAQARFFFWQDTVRPLAIYIFEEIQDWLSQLFEMEIKLHLDFASIPAFAEKTQEWLRVFGSECLNNKEKRELMGLSTETKE